MKEPNQAYEIVLSKENHHQGWVFGAPVGIETKAWPRSRKNGLPMAHIWTLFVPEAYRVKGKELVAISLFQSNDEDVGSIEQVSDVIEHKAKISDPEAQSFWDALLAYAKNKHPMEVYMKDILDAGWALVWLTEAEFKASRTAMPDQSTCKHPDIEDFEGRNLFKRHEHPVYVQLVEREDDPNVGKALKQWQNEDDKEAYIPMYSEKGEKLRLSDRFSQRTHFGGTANPIQTTPSFSPFYIEFEEGFGGANIGGGNAQIDLLNDKLDWAYG